MGCVSAKTQHKDPDGAWAPSAGSPHQTVLEIAWMNEDIRAAVAETFLWTSKGLANCLTIKIFYKDDEGSKYQGKCTFVVLAMAKASN